MLKNIIVGPFDISTYAIKIEAECHYSANNNDYMCYYALFIHIMTAKTEIIIWQFLFI